MSIQQSAGSSHSVPSLPAPVEICKHGALALGCLFIGAGVLGGPGRQDRAPSLQVQVPNCEVSTQTHGNDSQYGNPNDPIVRYFRPLVGEGSAKALVWCDPILGENCKKQQLARLKQP